MECPDSNLVEMNVQSNDGVQQAERRKRLTMRTCLSAEADHDSKHPNVDVVHVTAIRSEEGLHSIGDLITSVKTERREFVFRFKVASLLLGDLAFGSLEQQATELLSELTALRKVDERPRAIIFVAYDLGALVVKLALSLAGKQDSEYSEIFTHTARVIFSGCPQRSPDAQTMELKLFEFLSANKDDTFFRLDLKSVCCLAECVLRTTEMFISSKITIRSRVISIYARENKSRVIHSAFDYFTATLGVPTEFTLWEEDGSNSAESFPSLSQHVSYQPSAWVPNPKQRLMENTFIALASPDCQFNVRVPPHNISNPILESETHAKWMKNAGPQLIYIHGRSYRVTHDIADQVFLALRRKCLDKLEDFEGLHASFTFDSSDPLRNSVPDMVASIFTRNLLTNRWDEDWNKILEDICFLNCGWNDKAWMNVFETIYFFNVYHGALLLLHNVDDCDQDGRAKLFEKIRELSDRCEISIKIIITSRRPSSLLEELQSWLQINTDEHFPSIDNRIDNYIDHLANGCSMRDEREQIISNLSKLASMDKNGLNASLRLIQQHSGWPKDPSSESLAKFTHLLSRVNPDDTPEKVLDMILRSNHDIGGLCWILNWVLFSHHPLSRQELATVLLYHDQKMTNVRLVDRSCSTTLDRTWHRLESWLRVLVEFNHDQVTIRNNVRNLLKEDTEACKYIWNEVQQTAHQILTEFCFAHICLDGTISHLKSISQKYQPQVDNEQQSQQIDVQLLPDGQDITFYVVQSLPYHLKKCPASDRTNYLRSILIDSITRSESFILWAKVYWAMSNPFSRALMKPPDTPLPILAGLGMISYENINKDIESLYSQCLIAAAGSGEDEVVTRCLRGGRSFTVAVLLDALKAAIQIMDEKMALEIARVIKSYHRNNEDSVFWPESIVWTATWLSMDELLGVLLDGGASSEPHAINFFPSPFCMASRFGHASICRILLAYGAHIDVRAPSGVTALLAAISCSALDTIQVFIDESLYFKSQDLESLLERAVDFGSYKMVEALLNPQINPNGTSVTRVGTNAWTPLQAACYFNRPKTVQTLLDHGADPDLAGSVAKDPPLWFAVSQGPHLECIRLLLHHGADPSHASFTVPLVINVISSIHNVETIISLYQVLRMGRLPMQLNDLHVGFTALIHATYREYTLVVRWLLENGADVNAVDCNGESAICVAVKAGNIALIEEILKYKPNLDITIEYSGKTLLQIALSKATIVKLLLDAGADPEHPNKSGDTLINYAVWDPSPEVVSLLIEKKVNIHHRDSSGLTPIWAAVSRARSASLVRILADGGANMGEIDDNGQNLFHVAVNGPSEIIKILLEFGRDIDINHRDKKKRTPLLAAKKEANVDCLKLLIKAGCDINARDSDELTALHQAVLCDSNTFVSVLLTEPRVDVNHASLWGMPLHIACRRFNIDNVRAILDRGVDVNAVAPKYFLRTPLMAALLPNSHISPDQDGGKADQVVRTLVRNGADARFISPGNIFYSPIMVACLGAEVNTINFLLDEGASVQLSDPNTGRVPLHFAAANGIRNFQAVLLSYRGDMMVADKEGKNCLHWAAQFGNTKTIECILSRLKDQPTVLAQYLEQADSDGWTPLCWAIRPCQNLLFKGAKSEKTDHVGSVRVLLQHGAKRALKCKYGQGKDAETTLLVLAQMYDTDAGIIKMLKYGIQEKPASEIQDQSTNGDTLPVRRYGRLDGCCDICLGDILGFLYKCSSCPYYYVCMKCVSTAASFHNARIIDDGEPHTINLDPEREEYQDMPQTDQSAGQTGAGETPVEKNENNTDDTGDHFEELEVDSDDDDDI